MNLYMQISKNEKKQRHLLQILFPGIIICLSILLAAGFAGRQMGNSVVSDGKVDLEEIDFLDKKSVQLKGEWEYFAGKLIVTEKLPNVSPDSLVQVPGYESGEGWGSYRIVLENCPPEIEIAVPLRGMPAASRIFINGKGVEKSGIVSNGTSMEITADFSEEALLPLRSSTCELVVETSGRLFQGLSIAPVLMQKEAYTKQYQWYQALVFLLLGTNILFVIAYAMGIILTPACGYSLVMFAGLLLLLGQEAAMDPVYSVLPGNTLIPYDDVFLASYLFKVVSWWIFIRQECRTKKNRTMWLCWQIGLVFCLAIPVLCRISGDTRWWIISDAVTGILLLGSSLRTFFKTDTDVIMLHTGLWFLWTGSFLGDLAVSGYAPFTYRAFMFAGGTLFQLSIYSVDRRRVRRIQEKALETANLETELEHAKTELALHQIKPHFLHNALMSIKVLCRRNPSEAEQAVYNFAVFLRSNMKTIESEEPIPFSEELKTIEAYLSIEQIRFGKKLQVVWDIQEKDFYVPPLTIQPIVENAVRHGICNKPGGGTVRISSGREENEVWIRVEDDGVGFDVESLEQNGGIGIKNLRLRLASLLGAELQLQSRPGEGCIQVVRIPLKQ